MKLFVPLLLCIISVSCYSSTDEICTKEQTKLQVVDFSLCVTSKKIHSVKALPGLDTSVLVKTKTGTFILSNMLAKNGLNDLPSKLGLSNHQLLSLLFSSNEEPYSEIKPAFFIDETTKLVVAELKGGFTYFLIDNGDIEHSKAYITSRDDSLYLLQVTEGPLMTKELLP